MQETHPQTGGFLAFVIPWDRGHLGRKAERLRNANGELPTANFSSRFAAKMAAVPGKDIQASFPNPFEAGTRFATYEPLEPARDSMRVNIVRPLALDIVAFFLPGVACVLLFLLGRRFSGWPKPVRGVALLVAVAGIALGLSSLSRVLPANVERIGFQLGGMTTLLCWVATFLLGVVWGVPGRSLSSGFLIALAGIAVVLVSIESSGRLWWRFAAPTTWKRTVNGEGLLQQSSSVTCSPTAAVMLLNLAGIPASEGEMAYLSGTSVLGTDAPGMSLALEEKAAANGWRVQAGPTTYDQWLGRSEPFIAHVKGRYLGHAVTVFRVFPEGVILLDPATGQASEVSRRDFEENWDGMAIWLVR